MSNIDSINLVYYLNFAEGFGFNTNFLETNVINLAIVIGVLIYFGKGVLTTLLENRQNTILTTIRDAQERYQEATEKLNEAKLRLEEAKKKAEKIRVNGLSQIELEKQQMIESADEDFKRLNDSKNNTIQSEQQKVIQEVKQQVSKLALQKALDILNTSLNVDMHTKMIDYHIGLLKNMQ